MAEKYGFSKRNWFQEIFGGDDPYADYDDPWTRLSGSYGGSDADLKKEAVRAFKKNAPEELKPYLSNLTEDELLAIANPYFVKEDRSAWDEFWTGENYTFDMEAALKHLSQLGNAPTRPDAEALLQAAQDAIAAENQQMYDRYDAQEARLAEQEALLDQLRDSRTASYESDLASVRDDYSNLRTNVMSQQHQQNAQLMDTMQSQMSKQQRNAIEAGASAGLRIAGNINTMLSVQNKQAQQSLDTSNQLAQMLLNQRAAERGLRTDYDNYMSQDAEKRASIDANRAGIDAGRNQVLTSTQGRVDSKYNTDYNVQNDAYNSNFTDWKSAYSDNPFADSYYSYQTKSKYSKGGT